MTQVPYDDIRRALEKAEQERDEAMLRLGSLGLNPKMPSDLTDLCARLGAMGSHGFKGYPTHHINPDGEEAAAAIEHLNTQVQALLADAQRWRMIAEPSEEVVEKVAHEISKVDHSGRCHLIQGTATEWSNPYCDCDIKQRRARAVLRALKGLVK